MGHIGLRRQGCDGGGVYSSQQKIPSWCHYHINDWSIIYCMLHISCKNLTLISLYTQHNLDQLPRVRCTLRSHIHCTWHVDLYVVFDYNYSNMHNFWLWIEPTFIHWSRVTVIKLKSIHVSGSYWLKRTKKHSQTTYCYSYSTGVTRNQTLRNIFRPTMPLEQVSISKLQ